MERGLEDFLASLRPNITPGAQITPLDSKAAWRLEIPAGPAGKYRLAQLDDYGSRPRRSFAWRPPIRLVMRARASVDELPGTWGFGFWNDPFGMAILSGAEVLRLPVLPNAAWFFFASTPNYLSLRDDLPAQGGLVATFRAPRWPAALLALGAPALPLFLFRSGARLLRRLGRRVVHQSAAAISSDPTLWHQYEIEWKAEQVVCRVDGVELLATQTAPLSPLGFVMWVDNQYAGLPPDGKAAFGTLANPQPAWIEVQLEQFAADLEIG